MRLMQSGYRGLSIFVGLNIDRILAALAIGGAMTFATWIQSI